MLLEALNQVLIQSFAAVSTPNILTYFQSMAQFEKEKQASLSNGARPEVTGFDSTSGGTWIYPTNYPVRQYQVLSNHWM